MERERREDSWDDGPTKTAPAVVVWLVTGLIAAGTVASIGGLVFWVYTSRAAARNEQRVNRDKQAVAELVNGGQLVQPVQPPPAPQKPLLPGLSALGIWNTYNQNPADGDVRYAGSILEVKFEVNAIQKVSGKYAVVQYCAMRQVAPPASGFGVGDLDYDKGKYAAAIFDDPKEVAPLNGSGYVVIRCEVKDFKDGGLTFDKCKVVEVIPPKKE